MSSGVGGNAAKPHFASFDATGGFVPYGDEDGPAVNHQEADEKALIEAAREELATVNRQKTSRRPPVRSHITRLADQVLSSSEGQPTFGQRLGQLLRQTHTQLPTVTIEYRGLSVEADALVGTGGNPSVANAFLGVAKAVTLQGGLRTRRVQLLKDVNGVLEPGRLTLVLGPPGSGKTLLLKALSGRLPTSRHLRIAGSVRYNGSATGEFVIRRTAGLVEQQDHHMPSLTVLETLTFAARCQNHSRGLSKYLEELDGAAAKLKGQKKKQTMLHGEDGGVEAAEKGEVQGGAAIELQRQANGSAKGGVLARAAVEGEEGGEVAANGTPGWDLDVEAGLGGKGAVQREGRGVLQPQEFDEEFYRAFREITSHQLSPHLIMGIMGLSHCADTMVGNEMMRGISGGERKRLTTAEILVGPQSVLLMDEISTGLDSATAYSVVRSFRDVAHSLQKTIAISLLQPAPEVINLFDDLLLLTEGQVIYHGPVDAVLPFFFSLGYECPVRKDPGSFLQEVTTPVGQLAYATLALLGAKGVPEERRRPEELLSCPPKRLLTSVEEIRDAFWSREKLGATMLERLEQRPFKKEDGSPYALFKSRFANSSTYLSGLLFQRLGLLSLRMRGFYMARVIQTAVMGLIIGSLFVNIQPTPEDGRTVLAVCTLSIIFVAFSNMPQLSLVFATKRVFYKHRDAHLFPSWSYVCGMALVQIPQSTAEAVMYSLTVYFLTNFTRTAGGFFTFLLVAWSCSNCLAGLFRLLAYAGKTMVAANSAGGFVLLLMMMTNGFTIVRSSIPPYIVWIYWINPIAWSIRAVSVNELTSPRWSQPLPPSLGGGTLGEAVLAPFGFYAERYWIWSAVGFLWGSLLLYSVLGAIALKYTEPPQPRATVGEEEDQKEEVTRGLLAALRRRRRQLGKRLTRRRSLTRSVSAADASKSVAATAVQDPLGDCNGGGGLSKVQGGSSARGGEHEAGEGGAAVGEAPHVVVPFTPITLVCKDIRYYVDDPSKGEAAGVVKDHDDKEVAGKLELLKGISLYAEPGQLMALMGGSGAGKTTLMDVVCGRKTVGLVRGDIFVNGHPKQQETWSRVVGYVEQNDIHSAGTTVREALMFSARLRLDEKTISLEQVRAIVEETLEMVELWRLADSVVGEAGGDSGLSMEQRKRLSIAVELVANPAVVFMDEPTSGLDARAAAIVMRAVENVARSHRTVMVTIHQPSTEIFEAFDNLVLLQLGGRLAYFGPLGVDSSLLIEYLQKCPGVDPLHRGFNPATWMLEVTGGSMATVFRHAGGDFPEIYKASQLRADNDARMEQLVEQGRARHEPLKLSSRYATSLSTQRKWLVKRFFAIYWRCPEYNFTRIAMAVSVGLIYGITFLNQGRLDEEGVEIKTVQNIMGLIFSMVIFLGMFNAMTVQPMVAAERVVFYRETAASMYSPAPYGFATGLAEIPYIAAQSIIMVCITYWMVGLQAVAWKFFYFLLVFTMSLMMYTFFGQFLVFLTPNILIATILVAAFNQLWTIFNGFLIPYSQIPRGWQWMNRISPTTWILYGLGGSQLADSAVPMVGIAGERTTVGEFMGSYFDYEASFVWWCVLILGAYLVAFRVAAVLLLRHISYQKR